MMRHRLVLAAAVALAVLKVATAAPANDAEVALVGVEPLIKERDFMTIYEIKIEKLIDKHIDLIRSNLDILDPASLEDIKYNFMLISYTLTRGWLQNLAKVRRGGDCKLTYKNRELIADLKMVWYDIAFDYRYDYKAWPITKSGDFHGQMYDLFVDVSFKYDFKNNKFSLDKFKFTKVGQIKISTEGNILDKLGQVFMKPFIKLLKNVLMKVIEKHFRRMLDHQLPSQQLFDDFKLILKDSKLFNSTLHLTR